MRKVVPCAPDEQVLLPGFFSSPPPAAERPVLEVFRSHVVLRLYRKLDGFVLHIARLRQRPVRLGGLTAEQALVLLSEELA